MKNSKKHHRRRHYHAPFIDNLDLMNSVMLAWLVVAIIGFVLNGCLQMIQQEYGFAPSRDKEGWQKLKSHGDIELMCRTIIPTQKLHAFRAVATTDVPIETMLHVFRDTPNAHLWVKGLKEEEAFHKSGAHHQSENTQIQTWIVRDRFKSPIGFADREYLMTKVRYLDIMLTV